MKRIFLLFLLLPLQSFSQSWTSQTSGTTNNLYDISFSSTNPNNGMAVGSFGTVLITTNAGQSWSPAQSVGTTNDLYEVYNVDGSIGYAIGPSGTFLKTTDGGKNWQPPSTLPTNLTFQGIYFSNATVGYVVGINSSSNASVIYKTTNGGQNWSITNPVPDLKLNAVFMNLDFGWAVGDYGMIHRTTNSGNIWAAQSSGVTANLNDVYFIDNNSGYIVGMSGTIRKTTNGGSNWIQIQSPTTNDLRSVYFTDINTGWIIGYGGIIYKTTDGGTTWVSQNSGTINNLWALSFTGSSTGYVCGYSGTILKYSTSQSDWIKYSDIQYGLTGARKVKGIDFASNGDVWIAASGSGGAAKFSGTSWTAHSYSSIGFSSSTIFSDIIVDKVGNVYISGYGVFPASPPYFASYNGTSWTSFSNSYLQTQNRVDLMTVDPGNNKWMARGMGVVRYDGTQFTDYPSSIYISNHWVMCISAAAGYVWVGTSGMGVCRWDGTDFVHFQDVPFTGNIVNSLSIDAGGNPWIGSESTGQIAHWNGTSWDVLNVPVGTRVNSITINSSVVLNKTSVSNPLSSTSSKLSSGDIVWVGTNSGLVKWDGSTWTTYTVANTAGGLPNDSINCVKIASNGKIWVGTNNGLAVLSQAIVVNPVISLSPSLLDCGTNKIGSSINKIITVSNTGTADLLITQTTISGADASVFTVVSGGSTPSAPITISAGSSKSIVIAFTPTSTGSKVAALQISHNASGGSSSVSLSGVGTSPAISLSSTSISYGNVNLGSSSNQTFTISNTGTDTLKITSLSFTGTDASQFSIYGGGSVPINLLPGNNINLVIRFAPISVGNKAANLQITHNAFGSTSNISLAGSGIGTASISISHSTLSFGNVSVGTTSGSTLEITNSGTGTLTITKLVFGGTDASVFSSPSASNLPIIIPAGGKNTLIVDLKPVGAGNKSATLEITHNASGSPSIVALSGTGVVSNIGISTKELNFGFVEYYSFSDNYIDLKNSGTTTIRVDSLFILGQDNNLFTIRNQAPPINILPSDSIRILIRFSPVYKTANISSSILSFQKDGEKNILTLPSTATLVIVNNDMVNPRITVSLRGEGAKPEISISDTVLNFGNVNVADTSFLFLSIKNTNSNTGLRIDSLYFENNINNSFILKDIILPININPVSDYTLKISFSPGINQSLISNLIIKSSDFIKSPSKIQLIAKVTLPNISLLNNSTIDLGTIPYEASKDTFLIFSNSGDGNLIINDIKFLGDSSLFLLKNGKPNRVVLPGKNDSLQISLLPWTSGADTSKTVVIRIFTNIYNKKTIDLNIKSKYVFPKIVFPQQLVIGKIKSDSTKIESISVTNSGESNLTILTASMEGKDASEFSFTNVNFPINISQGKSFLIPIKFAPRTLGVKDARAIMTTNDPRNSQIAITLNAESIKQNLISNLNSIDFGKTSITNQKDTVFILKNEGSADLNVISFLLKGDNPSQFTFVDLIPTTSFLLKPGESKNIKIRFKPDSGGVKNSVIEITSNDNLNPNITISLIGTGLVPQISFANVSSTSKLVDLGSISAACNCSKDTVIIIQNKGEGILKIVDILWGIGDDNEFKIKYSPKNNEILSNSFDSIRISYIALQKSGERKRILIIKSNDPAKLQDTITVKVLSTKSQIMLSTTSVDMGKVLEKKDKDVDFTLKSSGTDILKISQIYISGTDSSSFSVLCSKYPVLKNFSININDSLNVTVRFRASEQGKKSAKVIIQSNDFTNPNGEINLTGEGYIPSIALESNQIADFSQDKQLSFNLDNTFPPFEAKVFYRLGGNTKFDSSIAITPGLSGNLLKYNYSFPKSTITERGLDYYIKVIWAHGLQVTLPSEYDKTPFSYQIKFERYLTNFNLLKKNYSMRTVPFQFTSSNLISSLFENFGTYNNAKWRIFKWLGGDYSEVFSTESINLNVSDGFWIITNEEKKMEFKNCLTIPTNSPYKITLKPGWNQIGNPFLFPVQVSGIVIPPNAKIESSIWRWDLDGQYSIEMGIIDPFSGYFIKSNETSDIDIFINPKYANSIIVSNYESGNGKSTSNSGKINNLQNSEWLFILNLVNDIQNDQNRTNYLNNLPLEIGTFTNAQDEWDNFDISFPPPVPSDMDNTLSGLKLSISNDNWRTGGGDYLKDFKSIGGDGKTWEIDVNPLIISDNTCLELKLIGKLPELYNLELYDQISGKKIEQRIYSDRIIVPLLTEENQTINKIRIIVGTKEFSKKEIKLLSEKPRYYSLSQNYPNPFNPSTRIEYIIPENSYVLLKIYNYIGQEIETLIDEDISIGKHYIDWYPKNLPTGIYYYKFHAGVFNEMKKMLYIR